MTRKIEKIIEEQIQTWRHSHDRASLKSPPKKVFPIITISRQFGARGGELGSYLEKEIDFKKWDKNIIRSIAKEIGGGVRSVESLDERHLHRMQDTVTGFLMNIPTNVTYLRSLIRVVKTIEEYGKGIIVGRGANYICQNPDALHVRVVCPLIVRINEYAARENLNQNEARLIIEKKEREREEFIKQNFHKNVANPSDYDLILNSETFSLRQMADLVISAYEIKTGMKLNGNQ